MTSDPHPAERSPASGGSAADDRSFVRRALRVARIDRSVFHEVAVDPSSFSQAAVAVVLGGLAQTIGTAGLSLLDDEPLTTGSLITGVVGALLVWLVPAAILWVVGTRMMRARAELGAVVRAVGFSAVPQLFYLLCLPARALAGSETAPWTVAALVWVLTQAALFVSVQETLATGALRTLVVFTIAGVLTAAVGLALALVLPAALWQQLVI